MRTWSIMLGVIIFVCVVTVSFAHTVDLYKRVGFLHWEAVTFTIAVETTFLLSGWAILWRRLQGQKPGAAAYAGFLYGIILVLFSNSAYTVGLDNLFENKIAQWTLALSVVLGVIIAEMIISQNLFDRSIDRSTNQSINQPASQMAELANQPTDHQQPASQLVNQEDQPARQTNQPPGQPTNQPTNQPSESANYQPVDESNQPVDSASDSAKTTIHQPDDQLNRPSSNVADQPAGQPISQRINQSANKAAKQPASQSTNQPTKRSNVVDMSGKRMVNADQKVVEVAKKYYHENGELPSRRQLAAMADTTPYRASKAINYLKEKYNIIDRSTKRSASGR